MKNASTRASFLRFGAVMIGVLLVAALAFTGTRAAFTAQTTNDGNAFDSATITLTDDDSGSALFAVTNMLPGDTVEGCILVTYTGPTTGSAVASNVEVYASGYTNGGGGTDVLDAELEVTVEEGTGSTFNDCLGFTSVQTVWASETLDTLASSFAAADGSSASAWDPVNGGPLTTAYRVTVELPATAPDSVQGMGVSALELVWELQVGS